MTFSANNIRSTFLNFFDENGHKILPSASLVPQNDPTLLFTNAGMVPFKDIFAGTQKPLFPRATSSQKVVRAGGKHNDLDNVGYTSRHHTFFEMLGNFSFGDYFKERAILQAWTLLTKHFQIPKEKLLVTVYSEDEEAATLWKKIAGLPEEKIIRIPTSDNFWRMGDTGPCGPSSEIFYDHGPSVAGGPPGSPEEDGDRFTEIWNLVFMQYYEEPGKEQIHLPKPSIDTGLGLERFATILQNKHDNYDTDIFRPLIEVSADLLGQEPDGIFKTSHRVVVDHLRSTSFLIADGVLPEREGRGYVLRRIMRRAMRHLHKMGAKEPVFYKLLPALIQEMGEAYPELEQHRSLIIKTMKREEEKFLSLLHRGMGLLEEELSSVSTQGKLSGETAFRLYDTYGFPIDLTQDILRERNISLDFEGFEQAMEHQKELGRKNWSGSGDTGKSTHWQKAFEKYGETEFLGYDSSKAEVTVNAIFKDENELAEASVSTGEVTILLDKTPFYGESGGQDGDHGFLEGVAGNSSPLKIEVFDTKKQANGLFLHHAKIQEGTLKPGSKISASIEVNRRNAIRAHHSATHLLHAALRKILGEHVSQKGSRNSPETLRFDISHSQPLTNDEIKRVEIEVNEQIRSNSPVITLEMSPEEASKKGAMALFGEKYGNNVRVVSMNVDSKDNAFSRELCGGTHVERTGDIGSFRIISETAVGEGVRRLEAVCGKAAERYTQSEASLLKEIASLLKVTPQDAPEKISSLLGERKSLSTQISQLQAKLAQLEMDKPAEKINSYEFILSNLGEVNPKELKTMATNAVDGKPTLLAALLAFDGEKSSIAIALGDELQKHLNAVDLVKKASLLMGGKGGGGRPNAAQAGGKITAEKEIKNMLKESLLRLK
ncbi:alanine--tRNA ligase [Acetobacteraceae bacterium]|nr:alanine--tRNA ligase [Acetobacteraceae bacterium]